MSDSVYNPCKSCGLEFAQPRSVGRPVRYCSEACRYKGGLARRSKGCRWRYQKLKVAGYSGAECRKGAQSEGMCRAMLEARRVVKVCSGNGNARCAGGEA